MCGMVILLFYLFSIFASFDSCSALHIFSLFVFGTQGEMDACMVYSVMASKMLGSQPG